MAQGIMETDTYYPSSAGMQLQGASGLSGFIYDEFDVAMTITKTVGSGSPAYQMEALIVDNDGSFWVPVKGALLNAVGTLSRKVRAAAVRISAANGTDPGTDDDTPQYSLQAYRVSQSKV